MRYQYEPGFSEVRKNWAGFVSRRNARTWEKAGPAAVRERLGLLFDAYLQRKRQLRYFGLRPDIMRGTFEVFDPVRAKKRVPTLSETEFIKMSMVCTFTGHCWYKAAWALYRKNDPAEAAVELARFYDQSVIALGFVPLIGSAELLGPETKQWRMTLPSLAGFVRGQLRAGNRYKRLPESEEELERDRDALLEYYADTAPAALDDLTPEQRHHIYKVGRLEVLTHADRTIELTGPLVPNLVQVCKTEPVL